MHTLKVVFRRVSGSRVVYYSTLARLEQLMQKAERRGYTLVRIGRI